MHLKAGYRKIFQDAGAEVNLTLILKGNLNISFGRNLSPFLITFKEIHL